jgi:hypothetical protein
MRTTSRTAAQAVALIMVLAATAGASVALAGPAAAAPPDTWPDSNAISTLNALLLFGGGTLAAVLVITVLAMAPSTAKVQRHRPGRDWETESLWFGGPNSELAAQPAGGSHPALESSSARTGTSAIGATVEGGGAGARW